MATRTRHDAVSPPLGIVQVDRQPIEPRDRFAEGDVIMQRRVDHIGDRHVLVSGQALH